MNRKPIKFRIYLNRLREKLHKFKLFKDRISHLKDTYKKIRRVVYRAREDSNLSPEEARELHKESLLIEQELEMYILDKELTVFKLKTQKEINQDKIHKDN